MNTNEILQEIRDANLNYLMLARQMIRADRAAAIFRLGLSAEVVDMLDGLSSAQVVRLASGNMMLARFRVDDQAILGMLTRTHHDASLSHAHMALLMAAQPVEDIV
ncbi:MAG: flagellar transcriptional regulator FlhD [Pseudomonadota bacterium]|jgi:flagellar transcriptional activator FlhD